MSTETAKTPQQMRKETRDIVLGPGMFGLELKDDVMAFFEELTPLYDFFNRFKV